MANDLTIGCAEGAAQVLYDISSHGGTLKERAVINVASVKHRSPFRYPGGKTWLVPTIRKWIASLPLPIKQFAEPFAGGAIVSLSVLFEELVQKITLVEKDHNVGAVWQTIVDGGAPELGRLIADFDLTEANVLSLLDEELMPDDILQRAFVTIVRNRVRRGGILAPGASIMRSGENGRGLASRWYPATLQNRLLDLHTKRSSISFLSGDGIKYIKENAAKKDIGWFIDPPYTVAGRRLYVHSDLDHPALFREVAKLKGPFLMTYDDTDEIRTLADKNNFAVAEVAMKNTHHAVMSELLISRNIDWAI